MNHTWQQEMSNGIRTLEQLQELGHLSLEESEEVSRVLRQYQMMVSAYYLRLIDWDDPACPIRKQAIPSGEERLELPEEMRDPVGDHVHSAPPLLVHRYPDRALLFPTLNCPMYCRFCFRKVLLNEDDPIRLARDLAESVEYLQAHTEIREVILSGGDPLMLSDSKLRHLLQTLGEVEHIRRIRIHTRTPATLPMRFTPELLQLLKEHTPISLVAHFNHPRELTPEAEAALSGLRDTGAMLLNQTVLMRGINDNVETLQSLFEGLVDLGMKPYYLHHPDLTVGTQHFRVSIQEGLSLYRGLRGKTSGIAIPLYVMEVPGGKGKVAVDSPAVEAHDTSGTYTLHGPFGDVVTYVDPAHPKQNSNDMTPLSLQKKRTHLQHIRSQPSPGLKRI